MEEKIKVGIEKIGIFIPNQYIDLKTLAEHRGIDPAKWTKGIGQETMAVLSKDQDIISMGANACIKILDDEDKSTIDQIIFATESSLDFSKASSTYIHKLLDIQPFAKSYEIKQACYSATASIQNALDYVRLRPNRKVLVISSDVSKYGLNTSGEVTQGAGAIAFLISSKPKVLEILDKSVSYTENSFDFWRPSYSDYPLVEGKYSTELYISVFKTLVKEFENRYPSSLNDTEAILFHLPFSKMGLKALQSLKEDVIQNAEPNYKALENKFDIWESNYETSIIYGKQVGNIYTGSLYLGLISLLMNGNLEDGSNIALFSYGSGSVAEFFMGRLSTNYKNYLYREDIESLLSRRKEMSIETYEKEYKDYRYTEDVGDIDNTGQHLESGFYLEKVKDSKRYYNYKN